MSPGAKSKTTSGESKKLTLRLYVAGHSPNSVEAVRNSRTVCDEHFPGEYELEIVDIFESPERGLADGVLVTPTLLKLHPPPVRRVIGNMKDVDRLLLALGENA